jgi:hypothetical protein
MTRYLLGYVGITAAFGLVLVLVGDLGVRVTAGLTTTAIVAGVLVGRDMYRIGRLAGEAARADADAR